MAARTVVRLIVRVDNPRDRRPASRAWFLVPSVNRHACVKGGYSLGKAFAGFAPKTLGPFEQRPPRRVEKPLHLLFREASRELHRRKPSGVEDLVGGRIANAAEETRIGERPLDDMALADERVAKALEVGVENFKTSRIVGAEAVLAANDVERRPLLRARLGDEQCPLGKVERRQSDLPDGLRAARSSPKPPCDHQMKDEKEIVFEGKDDPLPEAAKLDNPLPLRGAALIVRTVPGVRKAVKWNSPFYGVEGQGWFLGIHCFANYVKVAFFRGASLRPIPSGESRQKEVRYLDIHEHDQLDEAQLAAWGQAG